MRLWYSRNTGICPSNWTDKGVLHFICNLAERIANEFTYSHGEHNSFLVGWREVLGTSAPSAPSIKIYIFLDSAFLQSQHRASKAELPIL